MMHNKNILQEKWEDYLFLTKEMHRFILLQELDMFSDLMQQREVLQQEIEDHFDTDYYQLSCRKTFLQQIIEANRHMMIAFLGIWQAANTVEHAMQTYEPERTTPKDYC